MARQTITRAGVDVGGTFTDLVALGVDGAITVEKIRSTPSDPSVGLWAVLDRADLGHVEALVHGTTVATNSLLERRGARVVLLATRGFEDLLWLRRQDRAALYDLAADHPSPVIERDLVVGVDERMGPDGVVTALEEREVERVVRVVAELKPESVAIGFLFSFRDGRHERMVAERIRKRLHGAHVVASADFLPVFREYERTSTTVAEAFLRPRVGSYVEGLAGEAGRRGIPELRIMASHGGTLAPEVAGERASALALSGPAGGVEGARLVGEQLGERNLLTLDMGGTSADASAIVDGLPLFRTDGEVGGVSLALPQILIETVGAGGGSIGWVDEGGALRVGPQSAGAVPGPACYGLGGEEATVTDAAIVLEWLDVERPLADTLKLDPNAARGAVERLASRAGLGVERCAEGMVEIAVAAMVRALKRVSVERGLDPREMVLVPFGGAGPLFACRLAEGLGMSRAIVPPHPGVLSALGLAAAPSRAEAVSSVHRPLGSIDARAWDDLFRPLESRLQKELPNAALVRMADCRYPGQGYELGVLAGTPESAAETFHEMHRTRFAHADLDSPVECVNIRLIAERAARGLTFRADRDFGLVPGEAVQGPRTLVGRDATVRIEAGWRGVAHESGALLVGRTEDAT